MKSRETLDYLSTINMQEIFLDIIQNGEIEDLENFITLSGFNLIKNVSEEKKVNIRIREMPLEIDGKHIIEVIINRGNVGIFKGLREMLDKRGTDSLYSKFHDLYSWHGKIDITELIVKNEDKNLLEHIGGVTLDALSYAFFNKDSTFFETIMKEKKWSSRFIDQPANEDSTFKKFLSDVINHADILDPVYIKRLQRICKNINERLNARLLETVLSFNSPDIDKHIDAYFQYTVPEKRKYGYFEETSEILDFLVSSKKFNPAKMAKIFEKFPADYKNNQGENMIDILDKSEYNKDQNFVKSFENVKKMVIAHEERVLLNQTVDSHISPKSVLNRI